jgi:hypothetical protein
MSATSEQYNIPLYWIKDLADDYVELLFFDDVGIPLDTVLGYLPTLIKHCRYSALTIVHYDTHTDALDTQVV